ncbi:MAG: HAMP domain-containing protein [Minisyncoccia bacterium]
MKLQIKIFLIFLFTIFLPMVLFLFNTFLKQEQMSQDFLKEKTKILSYALDAAINTKNDLEDKAKLQNTIYKFFLLYPDIIKISISVPVRDKLQIIASNKTDEIGVFENHNAEIAFLQDIILTQNLILSKKEKVFNAIVPIHIGGEKVGIYNIILSLDKEKKMPEEQHKELLIIVFSLMATTLFSVYFLNYLIIKPIKEIEEKCHLISSGNFNIRLNIKRKDEIGDLANHFDKMTERLQEIYKDLEKKIEERTKELEEAKNILEIKVRARTRELQEMANSLDQQVKEKTQELQKKIQELERFQKLAVGRELKMIELKKEIEKLKAQLKNKDKI